MRCLQYLAKFTDFPCPTHAPSREFPRIRIPSAPSPEMPKSASSYPDRKLAGLPHHQKSASLAR
nr:MAG TPA_asm: hypothetical protein [Caudoviricetes sp.]